MSTRQECRKCQLDAGHFRPPVALLTNRFAAFPPPEKNRHTFDRNLARFPMSPRIGSTVEDSRGPTMTAIVSITQGVSTC
jgi:hypothetical protein